MRSAGWLKRTFDEQPGVPFRSSSAYSFDVFVFHLLIVTISLEKRKKQECIYERKHKKNFPKIMILYLLLNDQYVPVLYCTVLYSTVLYRVYCISTVGDSIRAVFYRFYHCCTAVTAVPAGTRVSRYSYTVLIYCISP